MRSGAILALIMVLLAGACENTGFGPSTTNTLENDSGDGGGGGGGGDGGGGGGGY